MPVHAVEPDEILQDPALESRARRLSAHLRCLVCQNQSIDDSNAPLARDLRLLVRERLKAGDTDQQVMQFVVQRYGTFVLLRPPVDRSTLILWLAPLLLLGGAALYIWSRMRTATAAPTATAPPPLNDAERRRLEELMKDKGA